MNEHQKVLKDKVQLTKMYHIITQLVFQPKERHQIKQLVNDMLLNVAFTDIILNNRLSYRLGNLISVHP